MLTKLENMKVDLMKRSGMTVASEYAAARRYLAGARKAREMLAAMAPKAYGRSHYSAEFIHCMACALGARDRARLLRRHESETRGTSIRYLGKSLDLETQLVHARNWTRARETRRLAERAGNLVHRAHVTLERHAFVSAARFARDGVS